MLTIINARNVGNRSASPIDKRDATGYGYVQKYSDVDLEDLDEILSKR